MQYKFPIVLLPPNSTGDVGTIEQIGSTISNTIWSIRARWEIESNFVGGIADRLTAVEIFRSDGKEKVCIELHVHYVDNNFVGHYRVFKATFHYYVKVQKISTDIEGHCFEGHVVINSSCDRDNQSVASSLKLSDDLLHLLGNPDSFPDATLNCGAATIPVHRNILFARSPVLAAMFSSQMQEGLSCTANVTDIKPDVLQATLRYIYSGKTDHLTDGLAADMLFVADKYQLDELKSVCITELKTNVTVDNVFRLLVLGELHDRSLKTHAIDFLCRRNCFSQIEEMEEWKSLEMEYPSLAMEVLKSIVKFVQQKK